MNKLIILTPVYNDWDCLIQLSESILSVLKQTEIVLDRILVINDNSSIQFDLLAAQTTLPLQVINLNINVGHQRAIAIGLAYAYKNITSFDTLIIMDSDGEDKPEYIPILYEKAKNGGKIIFAERVKRSESLFFRLGYKGYKLIFRLLTNQKINFGNFSCIPHKMLSKIIKNPDCWNHYSGSVIKSKLPYTTIPSERGTRYAGESKMNLQNLLMHGFSSIAIYVDVVIYKTFLVSVIGIIFIFLSIVTLLYLRLFTSLTIPGWTSEILLSLINIGGLLFIITLLLFLLQLNQRNMRINPVIEFYENYIESINNIQVNVK